LGLFPALLGQAGTDSHDTLCDSHEAVLFSCATSRNGTDPEHPVAIRRKIISLCATPGPTELPDRLTYRFGPDRQHIELEYPTDSRPPREAFTSDFDAWAKGSKWSVTFKKGEYWYSVYNSRAVYEATARSNGGGVRVTRGSYLMSDLWCDGKELSPAIQDHMWRVVQYLPENAPDAP
jgi:hypothetical protein